MLTNWISSSYRSCLSGTSNTINIELEDNYTSSKALKSFSDWYKLVYGGSISYAQINAILVIDSSSLDNFEKILLDNGVVASKIEGPIQESLIETNKSMLSNFEFTLICGGIGVGVAIMGIYIDRVIPAYRRIRNRRKR